MNRKSITQDSESNFLTRLGWKLYMFKLEIYLMRLNAEHKLARRKYCRKGFHKLIKQSYGIKKPGKNWVYIHYLKCLHCNYLFFTTKAQKEKYLELVGKDKDSFSAFLNSLSSLKTKHSNKIGGPKGKDVSSRCPSDSSSKGDKK